MPDHATPMPGIDLAACEELMRGGSKSFFAASSLLPQRVRMPAIALYAFCRILDDIPQIPKGLGFKFTRDS